MPTTRCSSGKRRFRDEISAALAIADIQQKDDPSRETAAKRFYKCPECKGFHLTSRGKDKRA